MAKATVGQVSETVQTVVTKEVIRLELSRDEAEFVLNYLGQTVVGRGLRKHSDSVCEALQDAGINYDPCFPAYIDGGLQSNRFRGIQGGC